MISPKDASPIASNDPADASTLVLASSSPRRLALLRQIGIEPGAIVAPSIDESSRARELPRAYALRMAMAKLAAACARAEHPGSFWLAADTVVACGRRILPKAESEVQARACLELLSGRRHRVLGAIAVASPQGSIGNRLVVTSVRFKRLSGREIDDYLAAGEWQGKAGGYAIQGLASRYIPWINGSYGNVVGLPLTELADMLEGMGFRR